MTKQNNLVNEALLEVVADIAVTVFGRVRNALSPWQRDQFMDLIGGSRDLIHGYIIPWAKEYQAEFEKRGALVDENYIEDVDVFAVKKIAELMAETKEELNG